MILGAGPSEAVSFTDDTSLDQRKTAQSKVSIHCNVLREHSLDWYYRLLHGVPNTPGELKSTDVTRAFLAMAPSAKAQVTRTMKLVRVNITDPRPYVADYEGLLRSIIPGGNVKEFMARLNCAQDEAAKRATLELQRYVPRRMLWDSPSARLRVMHRALSGWFMPLPWMGDTPEQETDADFDFTPFENSGSSRINPNFVSVCVSKSGAVFQPAIDALESAAEHLYGPPTTSTFWGVNRELANSRAFDDGNRKIITWIDQERADALRRTDPYLNIWRNAGPLHAIDSRDSFFIQAADIAAGVVRATWEQQSLVHVARAFDYVAYNGRQIGESDAEMVISLAS